MTKKSLCVVTGTRAEYGLLRPVLQKLLQSDVIEPRLVVTGAHLAPEFGNTVSEIEADGMPIAARIPILKFGTGSPLATARTVSYTMERFTDYFSQNRPDAVLVLGDRYEIFAAGAAAALLEIPLAHISGGDVTAGAADDWFRHCLTKMASLHFPSCEVYARRLIRMGEDPAAVENVGGLGDENLRSLPLLSRAALAESIGFGLERPYALVTYHPETAGGASPAAQFDALCAALERCGLAAVFTKANADAGGADINARIDAVCAARPGQYVAFTSMGVLRYLSAMKYCAVVAGNYLRRSGNALAGRALRQRGRQAEGAAAQRQYHLLRGGRGVCVCGAAKGAFARLCRAGPASEKPLQRRRHQRAHRAAAGGVRAEPVAWKAQAVLRRPRAGVGKGGQPMSGLADSFREMWKTALTALGQLNTLVPAYWDGALDTALRVVRTALPLFAAVLLVQLVLLVFARRKRPRRILVFAGTLVVVLGLCVWACFPAWTAGA